MKVVSLGTGIRTAQCQVCDSILEYTVDEVRQPVKSMPSLCFVDCKVCGEETQVPKFVSVPEDAAIEPDEV